MTDLWGQIPRAAPKANVEKLLAKEREAAIKRELEKSKQYKLVESDEESPPKKVIKKEKNESDSDDEEKKIIKPLLKRITSTVGKCLKCCYVVFVGTTT